MHALLQKTRRRQVLGSAKKKKKKISHAHHAQRVHEDATIHKSFRSNYSKSLPAKSLEQMVESALSKHGSDSMKPSIEAMKKLADLEDQVAQHRLETKDIRARIESALKDYERGADDKALNDTLVRARRKYHFKVHRSFF